MKRWLEPRAFRRAERAARDFFWKNRWARLKKDGSEARSRPNGERGRRQMRAPEADESNLTAWDVRVSLGETPALLDAPATIGLKDG